MKSIYDCANANDDRGRGIFISGPILKFADAIVGSAEQLVVLAVAFLMFAVQLIAFAFPSVALADGP